jgi:hypothetical protein
MSLRRVTLVSAFASLLLLLGAVGGTASAQSVGKVSVGDAEALTQVVVDITGTGVCGLSGPVTLTVKVGDLDLGTSGVNTTVTTCTSPDEHINWVVGVVLFPFRPGDRALVDVTATGAIIDQDQKEVIIKQYR